MGYKNYPHESLQEPYQWNSQKFGERNITNAMKEHMEETRQPLENIATPMLPEGRPRSESSRNHPKGYTALSSSSRATHWQTSHSCISIRASRRDVLIIAFGEATDVFGYPTAAGSNDASTELPHRWKSPTDMEWFPKLFEK